MQFFNNELALISWYYLYHWQERIIERLKEQRERDDRERLEETESYKKENKDLKEKVNALQAELTEKEVSLHGHGDRILQCVISDVRPQLSVYLYREARCSAFIVWKPFT